MNDDIQQLNLLSIFHYVVAAMLALVGCFPIIHLVLGIAIVSGAFPEGQGEPPPQFIGVFFIACASFMILLCWAFAIALCVAARRLKQHVGYYYCLVVAAVACTFIPFGTVLGVFTIIVLMRPTVKSLFGVGTAPAASS